MGNDRELEAAQTSGPTEDFSLIGQQFVAKVVSVYDGDTLRVKFRTGPAAPIVQMVARMDGYDSPEIKPPLADPDRELHVRAAKVARGKLEDLVGNQMVCIRVVKPRSGTREKFGRLLVEMHLASAPASVAADLGADNKRNHDEQRAQTGSINQWMVDRGLGKPYKGGTKVEFTRQELQAIVDHASSSTM